MTVGGVLLGATVVGVGLAAAVDWAGVRAERRRFAAALERADQRRWPSRTLSRANAHFWRDSSRRGVWGLTVLAASVSVGLWLVYAGVRFVAAFASGFFAALLG